MQLGYGALQKVMDGSVDIDIKGLGCSVERRCEGDGKTGIWIGGDVDEF